jgi:hypothetical protein
MFFHTSLRALVSRLIIFAVFACAEAASAQIAGQCIDKRYNVVFNIHNNGLVPQAINPMNAAFGMRDPSGVTFMRLPSARTSSTGSACSLK